MLDVVLHVALRVTPSVQLGAMRRRFVVSRAMALALAAAAAGVQSMGATPPVDRFIRFPEQQVLVDADVRAIAQDRDGFLWFGTRLRGLARFDGRDVKVFQDNPADPHSFGHQVIWSICVDRHGSLWVGTVGGLARLDRETNTFHDFHQDPKRADSLPSDVVLSVFEDSHGTLWIATRNGLARMDDRQRGVFTTFIRPPPVPRTTTGNTFRSITEDPSTGLLWLGASDGLAVFDPRTGRFASWLHDAADPSSLGCNAVNKIIRAADGVFWALTEAGLDRFVPTFTTLPPDGSTPPALHFQHYLQPTAATQPGINYIRDGLIDHKGRMWLATRGGVELFNPSDGTSVVYRTRAGDASSLSDNLTHTVFEDRSGNLWVGTYAGGVCRLQNDAKPFQIDHHIPEDPKSIHDDRITGLTFDRNGRLWAATTSGLSRRDADGWTNFLYDPTDPASLPTNDLATVTAAPNGDIWIGTPYGGVIRYDGRSFHPLPSTPGRLAAPTGVHAFTGSQVNSILADNEGGMWLAARAYGLDHFHGGQFEHFSPEDAGTPTYNALLGWVADNGDLWYVAERQGLVRYAAASKHFTVFELPTGATHGSDGHTLLSIARGQDGLLWLGAADGLLGFDPKTEKFVHHYATTEGLPNSSIMEIVPDLRGHLWLGTADGLADLDPGTGRVRTYDRADGLPSNAFAQRSGILSPDGRVFLGTRAGVLSFRPEELHDDPEPPPVVITEVRWLGGDRSSTLPGNAAGIGGIHGALQVAPRQLGFSLRFAALDFSAPEKNQYRYRLEGLDAQWTHTTAAERIATYTALPPGRYLFHVQASNADGIWNEQGAMLPIIIAPTLWQTTWFRLLAAIAALLGVTFALRLRLRSIRRRNTLLEEQVALRTAQLEKEIAVRHQAEAALRESHDELERRVQERTAELTATNSSLAAEIDERRKVEAQLRQSQKMEAIGQLAGGIAHDFNNLLTVIIGQSELLSLDDHPTPALRSQALRDINAAAQRAAKLTRQLLVFSRREPMRLAVVDVNGLVAGEIDLLRRLIGEDIVLRTAFASGALPVFADVSMLQQLLLNLVLNARDAMPQGGALTLATRAESLAQAEPARGPHAVPGDYVCISVSDTGVGISADVLPRIFEPFFTTKERGKGTGLGLAITHSIVQQHRGWIQVDTASGAGTTFHIWLPKQQLAAGAASSHGRIQDVNGGGATVLVVEDEAEVRAIATRVLRHHGFNVLEAGCGAEALEQWKAHRDEVSVLLTDIIMPGRPNGRELADQLQQDRPDLRVITMSGYDPGAAAERTGGGAPLTRYLKKPFTVGDLLAAFAENNAPNTVPGGQR